MRVITDVLEFKKPWLAENHSGLSQIAGVALMNDQKDHPVCGTGLGSLRIVKYIEKIAHSPEIIGKPYWLAKERADSCNRSKCRCCMSFKSL